MWYYISEPNSYLAITGGGIETVRIVKKAFVMPWQKVSACSACHSPCIDLTACLFDLGRQDLHLALRLFSLAPGHDN